MNDSLSALHSRKSQHVHRYRSIVESFVLIRLEIPAKDEPVRITPILNTTKGREKPLISKGTVSLRYTPSGKLPDGCDDGEEEKGNNNDDKSWENDDK